MRLKAESCGWPSSPLIRPSEPYRELQRRVDNSAANFGKRPMIGLNERSGYDEHIHLVRYHRFGAGPMSVVCVSIHPNTFAEKIRRNSTPDSLSRSDWIRAADNSCSAVGVRFRNLRSRDTRQTIGVRKSFLPTWGGLFC